MRLEKSSTLTKNGQFFENSVGAAHLSSFGPFSADHRHPNPKNPLFDPKTKVVPRAKRDELKRVSGETATFWGTPPGPKIQTFSESGRGSIGRTDENSDQKMDQNVAKTSLIPDEIRAKKVSKRREMAKIHEKVVGGRGGLRVKIPTKIWTKT